MNGLRTVIVEPLPEWLRDLYAAEIQRDGFELHWLEGAAAPAAVARLGGAEVLVTGKRRVSTELIEAAGPGLRLVQVLGRAPWAVDLDAAERAGASVSFMPHRGAIAVAEHTLALMLGLYRKLLAGHEQTVAAAYVERGIEPIDTDERTIAFNWMGFDDVRQLYGKVLGLVGLGDIGLEVARRARAFDMQVLYAKRNPLPAGFDEIIGARHTPLDELVRRSDILSLHAPHTDETERMIGHRQLDSMKQTAVLINTSRGGLVDEGALATCLRDRRIAGAGLDVFRREPLAAEHPFLELDNVLLCPHVGGGTGGGHKGMAADVAANIRRVAEGAHPEHLFTRATREVRP